jgi:adenine-specific DNA-methyltransferase
VAVRWLGSKARVVDELLQVIGPPTGDDAAFVDAFAGTGVVAAGAAKRGWRVRINDHLLCATLASAARLTAKSDVPFRRFGGYHAAIKALQRAPRRHGFIWSQYSPASANEASRARMYFTEENAAKIDGVRATIQSWAAGGVITQVEERLLIADLLGAVDSVANIAGTYGCFLSYWSPQACRPLTLSPRALLERPCDLEVFNVDVKDTPAAPHDTVYLDPPYTKRQYAAYYHIQETVAHGDEPTITGITGLRPWRHKSSDFCYKSRALGALVELAAALDSRRVFLSYSSEGHVALEDLRAGLEGLGALTVYMLGEVGRYRPNRAAVDAGSAVKEYLLELVKTSAAEPELVSA